MAKKYGLQNLGFLYDVNEHAVQLGPVVQTNDIVS